MCDPYQYKGKTVVLIGAYSGIGGVAGTELMEAGAELWALDVKRPEYEVSHFIQVDLRARETLDNALEQLPTQLDTVLSVAGIAGNEYRGANFSDADVVIINYLGVRYLLEQLLPRINEWGAAVATASIAGAPWPAAVDTMKPLVDLCDYDSAHQWILEHYQSLVPAFTLPAPPGGQPAAQPTYCMSKGLMVYWMSRIAYQLGERKVRFNTLSPGITTSQMSADFNKICGYRIEDTPYVSPFGRPALPEEQASALLWLGSRCAAYVSGIDLRADYAVANAGMFP